VGRCRFRWGPEVIELKFKSITKCGELTFIAQVKHICIQKLILVQYQYERFHYGRDVKPQCSVSNNARNTLKHSGR
jgi:hypothetical protein